MAVAPLVDVADSVGAADTSENLGREWETAGKKSDVPAVAVVVAGGGFENVDVAFVSTDVAAAVVSTDAVAVVAVEADTLE